MDGQLRTNDRDFERAIAELRSQLDASNPGSRGMAVAILESIACLFTAKAFEPPSPGAVSDPDQAPGPMGLYEGMHVYDLLEAGWRADLYSGLVEPDAIDTRLCRSLLAVVSATTAVMPGYDLNTRALGALLRHFNTVTGRSLVAPWIEFHSSLREYFVDQRPSDSDDWDDPLDPRPALQRIGQVLDDTSGTGPRYADPDAPIGVHEYVGALIDWRFDDDAVESYWVARAELTERALGIDFDRHPILVGVFDELPSRGCPMPWGGNVRRAYLEVPRSFAGPVSRAGRSRMFDIAQTAYKTALREFLVDLIVATIPDVTARYTTLRALWAWGLPEQIPTDIPGWGLDP